jgi:hypothetical protein
MKGFYILYTFLLFTASAASGAPGRVSDTIINQSLNLSFNKTDHRHLEKATEDIVEGRILFEKSGNMQNALPEQVTMMKNAYETYHKGIIEAKTIYEAEINKSYENIGSRYINQLGRPKHTEKKAYNYLKQAEKKTTSAFGMMDKEDYGAAKRLFFQVFELEYLGITNLARTTRVFQDWPVEYPYVWDDYVRPDDGIVMAASVKPTDTIKREPVSIKDSTIAPITFLVQIAAHTVPMTENYLRTNIYHGNEKITLIKEGIWYKYSIGHFDRIEDAEALLKQCQVDKAFVVAYQQGKKLDVKKAMELNKKRLHN